MCVSIQGEACGEVSQHAAGHLDIHSALKGDGVAETVESDLGMPALSRTRFSMLCILIGEMGQPLGEGIT